MKKKAGFLLLKGETFPYDVLVALGATKAELLSYADKRFFDAFAPDEREELSIEGAKGRTFVLKNKAVLLWLKTFPQTPADFGYLAHEIFHAADLTLRKLGATLSDDSDEIWAYQIDWLTRRIYSAFRL